MSYPNTQAPNLEPTAATAGPASMSTPETLAGIFFEPERTFESLRERPRFLIAGLILIALIVAVTTLVMSRVDFNAFITDQIKNGPNSGQMDDTQKQKAIDFWTGPAGKAVIYLGPIVATAAFIAAGAGLYLLATMAMGGVLRYRQALSVWVYSSFPPSVLGALIAVVLVFVKSKEDIDLNKPGAGLAVTNLGALIGDGSPVLRAALSWFDIFTFYGMYLAALGLRKVGKMSSASAWTIVIAFWFIGMVCGVIWSMMFGG